DRACRGRGVAPGGAPPGGAWHGDPRRRRARGGAGGQRGSRPRPAHARGHPHRGRDPGAAGAVHHRAGPAPLHGVPASPLPENESRAGPCDADAHGRRRHHPHAWRAKGDPAMNELAGLASFLASSFKEGGLVMYGILGIGVVAAAIALERFFVITGASVLNGKKLTKDVIAHITRGDLNAARNTSRKSNAPAAQVVQAVLAVTELDES